MVKKLLLIPGIWNYNPFEKIMTAVRGHKYHILPASSLPVVISSTIFVLILLVVSNLHFLVLTSSNLDFFLLKITYKFLKFITTDWSTNLFGF